MDTNLLFEKTALGVEEIRTRSGGLSPRQRQLLIMIDGHKPVSQLTQILPIDELEPRVNELLKHGLIAPIVRLPSPDSNWPNTVQGQPEPEDNGLPNSATLSHIRRILSMCSQNYLDGALDTMLIDIFDQMSSPDELTFCIDTWMQRMKAGGHGQFAEAYLHQIKAAMK